MRFVELNDDNDAKNDMRTHNRGWQDMSPFVSLPILFNFRGTASSESSDDIETTSTSSHNKIGGSPKNHGTGR